MLADEALPSWIVDELAAFERAVLAQPPPGAVLIGASVSPDGKYGAALTLLPSASYRMDDAFFRTEDERDIYE